MSLRFSQRRLIWMSPVPALRSLMSRAISGEPAGRGGAVGPEAGLAGATARLTPGAGASGPGADAIDGVFFSPSAGPVPASRPSPRPPAHRQPSAPSTANASIFFIPIDALMTRSPHASGPRPRAWGEPEGGAGTGRPGGPGRDGVASRWVRTVIDTR